jgi:hypothetical protein
VRRAPCVLDVLAACGPETFADNMRKGESGPKSESYSTSICPFRASSDIDFLEMLECADRLDLVSTHTRVEAHNSQGPRAPESVNDRNRGDGAYEGPATRRVVQVFPSTWARSKIAGGDEAGTGGLSDRGHEPQSGQTTRPLKSFFVSAFRAPMICATVLQRISSKAGPSSHYSTEDVQSRGRTSFGMFIGTRGQRIRDTRLRARGNTGQPLAQFVAVEAL